VGVIPWLHSILGMLQSTDYLTWHQTRAFLISVNNKSDFSGWFDKFEKGEGFGHCKWMWADTAVALHLRNAADYGLPTFGPHGTKLGHS